MILWKWGWRIEDRDDEENRRWLLKTAKNKNLHKINIKTFFSNESLFLMISFLPKKWIFFSIKIELRILWESKLIFNWAFESSEIEHLLSDYLATARHLFFRRGSRQKHECSQPEVEKDTPTGKIMKESRMLKAKWPNEQFKRLDLLVDLFVSRGLIWNSESES